jgi:GMP synthase (glutamine-hydrolysing)
MSAAGEMRRVLVVQHVAVEQPGVIGDVLQRRGVATRLVGPDEPLPHDASGIVVLGGPMGVYEADRHPRLREEIAMLERAIAAGKPVLGICLGSQLLAAALGARVYRGGHSVTAAPGACSSTSKRPRRRCRRWRAPSPRS